MTVAERKAKHPYIAIDLKVSGGQPVISGTRTMENHIEFL